MKTRRGTSTKTAKELTAGAGISDEELYRHIRNGLLSIARDISRKFPDSSLKYGNRELVGTVAGHTVKVFYEILRASNAETAGLPVLVVDGKVHSRFYGNVADKLEKVIGIPVAASEELKRIAKEVMGYGYHKSYGGDPYWITLRYPAHCSKCHKPLARGERAYYYPRGKQVFGESCGHGQEAEQDFHNQVEMEEGHLV